MITIELPRVLAPFANSNSVVTVDESCQTVRDALAALGSRFPGVVDRVVDERGDVRTHVNVFLNEESIRLMDGLDTRVPEQSNLMIVAAVSGG